MPYTFNKAITAAVLAGVAAALAFAIPVVDDGLTTSEILGIVLAFLTGAGVTGGATYQVRNAPETSQATSTPQL